MADDSLKPGRVQRRLVGEPMTFGARTVQPVASVVGWAGAGGDDNGSGGGGFVSVTPVEVIVTEGDGAQHTVPTPNATSAALRGILLACLFGPLLWLIVRLIVRRYR
ncbi:MAG: hypothetical protein U0641_17205 [Anaerolineae bacterium]